MTKEELRKTFREQRNSLTDKTKKSQMITKNIISSPIFQKASVVMLYRSAKGEVETDVLWQICKEQGKTCVFPKCVSKTEMIAVLAESEEDFSVSGFGILEPTSDEAFQKEQIDLIIVPALAFDRNHYRMGYGGGYYDRYLSVHRCCKTIAVCYNFQIMPMVPTDEHDVKPDMIITNDNIFKG
mgnify:CR=1 FL=1